MLLNPGPHFLYCCMIKEFPSFSLLTFKTLFWGHVTVSLGFNEHGSARGMQHLHKREALTFNANKQVWILVGSCSNDGHKYELHFPGKGRVAFPKKFIISRQAVARLARNYKQDTRHTTFVGHLQYYGVEAAWTGGQPLSTSWHIHSQ